MAPDFLHAARVERALSVADIARATGLSPRVVKAIDEGRFDAVPAGIYARSYVRTFAEAVGVPPALALETLMPCLPTAPDPFPVLRAVAAADPNRAPRIPVAYLATAVDVAILIALNLATLAVVAQVCGLPVLALLGLAPMPMLVLFAASWIAYCAIFFGLGRFTAGSLITGLGPPLVADSSTGFPPER
jgi:hypothetical protein